MGYRVRACNVRNTYQQILGANMFIPILFSQAFSIASTIFMIWMLIDCIRNPKIGQKSGWIIFIIITQFIGAAVYFFTRGPWPRVRQYLFQQRSFSDYQAPQTPNYQPLPAPQPMQEEFSAYERGYEAQQPAQYTQSPEPSTLQPEYEQSLLTYPEMPPMEQHQ